MTKTDFVEALASKSELTKVDAKKALDAVLAIISETLEKGDTVEFTGFGKFEVRERAERKGRNPKSGEEITIPASKAPAFKAGKKLKELVNK